MHLAGGFLAALLILLAGFANRMAWAHGDWPPLHGGIMNTGGETSFELVRAGDRRYRVGSSVLASNLAHQGGSATDGRTTRHASYRVSQTMRKRIEEHFGWGKTIGHIRQTVYRGIRRVDQHFKLTMTASNIVRMARILCGVPRGAMP